MEAADVGGGTLVLRNALLTLHLLSVIAWLGFGAFELLVIFRVAAYEDTPAEAPMLRLIAWSGPLVGIATLLVAFSGALMSWYLGWGFFQVLWLSIKQAIMLGVLALMVIFERSFRRIATEIKRLPPGPGPGSPAIREALRTTHRPVLAMRIGALVAVGLAVWRPA